MAPAIVRWPDPRLRAKAALAPSVDAALRTLGAALLEAARSAEAYGLAAAHIGEIAPVVVISGDGTPHRLLYSSVVIGSSPGATKGEEGSVSLPGVRVEVERADWVDIRFLNETGAVREERLTGFLARVAQHEIDQMNGVFFLDRVSRLKREMALKKAKKG